MFAHMICLLNYPIAHFGSQNTHSWHCITYAPFSPCITDRCSPRRILGIGVPMVTPFLHVLLIDAARDALLALLYVCPPPFSPCITDPCSPRRTLGIVLRMVAPPSFLLVLLIDAARDAF